MKIAIVGAGVVGLSLANDSILTKLFNRYILPYSIQQRYQLEIVSPMPVCTISLDL